MKEAYEFLSKGGIVMIPIALCSVIGLTIFLERQWSLQRQRVLPAHFLSLLMAALRERRWERAISLCDSNDSVIAKVVRSALNYVGQEREVVRNALQESGRREASFLEHYVGALGALASVAPLLGLLGTVTGMIKVFGRVAAEFDKGGELNPGLLANGIWEALITTAAGLTVAIPIFLLFRYLTARIDRYVVELEGQATEVLDLLAPPGLAAVDGGEVKVGRKGRSKEHGSADKKGEGQVGAEPTSP